jgi:hypothetical protein
MTYKDLIEDLKKESQKSTAPYSLKKEASEDDKTIKDDLSDLGLNIEEIEVKSSKNLEKIAATIEQTSNMEELIKVASEVGDNDILNLVKIADALSEKVADTVINRVKQELR